MKMDESLINISWKSSWTILLYHVRWISCPAWTPWRISPDTSL